ncbi:unnamed protein product [Discosporangium mesarthrocarpum]
MVDHQESYFRKALDKEVEKVVLFVLKEQGDLARRLLCGLGLDDGPQLVEGTSTENRKITLLRKYEEIGMELADLIWFIHFNVSGLRKILKKHDKQIRGNKIADHYLSKRYKTKDAAMPQLYHTEGVSALIGVLKKRVKRKAGEAGLGQGQGYREDACNHNTTPASTLFLFREEYSLTEEVFSSIEEAQNRMLAEQKRTIQEYVQTTMLHQRSGNLLFGEDGLPEEDRELDMPSAMINLATTFLYMTNYYIVGPTSVEYSAALGGSPAISGIIIGMTPIASCFSCLLYSWWTNTSYREPLLLCSFLLITGNLLYGLALTYDAFWMVLVGRTLIGLGGARGVNRRYIADTIPYKERTVYSAAFVAVGAMGMSFGPFIAAVLSQVDVSLGPFFFNGLTLPGWFMFLCWLVMGIVTFAIFKEPPHASDETPSNAVKDESKTKPLNPVPGTVTYGATEASVNGNSSMNAGAVIEIGKGGVLGERQPLMEFDNAAGNSAGEGEEDDDGGEALDDVIRTGIFAVTTPLLMCLFGYFVNKLIVESAVSSAPLLTQYFFHWSVTEVGMLMAALGLLVLPVNIIVGRMSMHYEDRVLMQALAVLALLGCLMTINLDVFPFAYTDTQYIIGVSLVFVTLQAHEGVIMSVTSKIIPVELARCSRLLFYCHFFVSDSLYWGPFAIPANTVTGQHATTRTSISFLLCVCSSSKYHEKVETGRFQGSGFRGVCSFLTSSIDFVVKCVKNIFTFETPLRNYGV